MSNCTYKRRVVIVDDSRTIQAMLDNAFSKRPDFQVVGFAGDATSAAELIRRLIPDVVTIDFNMPYLDGGALLGMIRDLDTVCKIVVSDKPLQNMALATRLIDAGASTYISKRELVDNPAAFFNQINAAASMSTKPKPKPSGMDGRLLADLRPGDVETVPGRLSFPVPADELGRLRLLRQVNLSNATRERHFDLITQHVAKVTAFPVCLLTFIDRDTQWIKSAAGLEMESTPRDQALCNYTISQGGAFVVTNTTADLRFANNPLVTDGPKIRSYAGQPIKTIDGIAIGALCVIDNRVRVVSAQTLFHLSAMAGLVAELVGQRRAAA